MKFEKLFDKRSTDRDKFLSMIFGIFSEKIALIWCNSYSSNYTNLGRPTIKPLNSNEQGKTLDFTLKSKTTGNLYVTEMKCEIQYENYKYLKLNSSKQFEHHKTKTAFRWLLELAQKPEDFDIKIKGQKIKTNGAILIWGVVDKEKKTEICRQTGFKDILSVEHMINTLIKEKNKEYEGFINEINSWTNYLYDNLKR